MRDAPDSPVMAGFMAAADPIYRMAEAAPGFVWRLRGEGGHMPTHRDAVHGWQIVNVSLWESYEDLHRYVYRSPHGGLVRRRAEWFLPAQAPAIALWWVARDHRPGLDESRARLSLLRREGPSPRAFSLRRRFHPDGAPVRRS